MYLLSKTLYPYYLFYTQDKEYLDIETLKKLLIDFEIFPELISIVKIKLFFKQCSNKEFSEKLKQEVFDLNSLNDFMALCAFEVPFKDPQPEPISKIIFLLQKISQSSGLKKVLLEMGLTTLTLKKDSIDILSHFKQHFPQYFIVEEDEETDYNIATGFNKMRLNMNSKEDNSMGLLGKEGFYNLFSG